MGNVMLKDIIANAQKENGFFIAMAKEKGEGLDLSHFANSDDFYEDERSKRFMEMQVKFIFLVDTERGRKQLAFLLN